MNYNQRTLVNYQFVSVLISSSGQPRYYFPDLPNLRDVITTNIVAYNPAIMATDPNGLSLSSAASANCFLTLTVGNNEVISKLDLPSLTPIASGTGSYSSFNGNFALQPTIFDYSKSYVEVYNPSTLIANNVFCFGIYYEYPKK